MEELDEAARAATMRANGTDKRGQGGGEGHDRERADRRRAAAPSVDVVTDFTITGRLAPFGRGGIIQDVSNRLLRDFAGCLQSSIESEPRAGSAPSVEPAPEPAPAKPVGGLSLFFARAGRSHPAPLPRLDSYFPGKGAHEPWRQPSRSYGARRRRACWTRTRWPLGAASFARTTA